MTHYIKVTNMTYRPDNWVVLKIVDQKDPLKVTYKLFGSWYGADSEWRLNSGITSVDCHPVLDYRLLIHGYSGSTYDVDNYHKNYNIASGLAKGVLFDIQKSLSNMDYHSHVISLDEVRELVTTIWKKR